MWVPLWKVKRKLCVKYDNGCYTRDNNFPVANLSTFLIEWKYTLLDNTHYKEMTKRHNEWPLFPLKPILF